LGAAQAFGVQDRMIVPFSLLPSLNFALPRA
jgi:hypothetical protein